MTTTRAARHLTVAALTVILAAGCTPASSDDPAGDEPAATASATPTEEPTTEEPTPETSEWGDGVWPEGYSFELPNGLSLQEEVIDPAEAGDLFESAPSYRRLAFDGHGPLMMAPESLRGVPLSQEELQQALAFGAQLYIEEFIDSGLLMKEYTRQTEREWFDGFRDQTTPELGEEFDALYDEPMGRTLWALSYSAFGTTEDSDSDGGGGASVPTDDTEYTDYVSFGPQHDEGGPRLANVEASLVDGEYARFEHGEMLELTYEGSQTVLLSVSDDEDDPERRLVAVTNDSEVTLGLWNDGSGWKLTLMRSHYSGKLNDPA